VFCPVGAVSTGIRRVLPQFWWCGAIWLLVSGNSVACGKRRTIRRARPNSWRWPAGSNRASNALTASYRSFLLSRRRWLCCWCRFTCRCRFTLTRARGWCRLIQAVGLSVNTVRRRARRRRWVRHLGPDVRHLPHAPPIRACVRLQRIWKRSATCMAAGAAFGVGTGPIEADDLHLRVSLQLFLQRFRFSIWQEINRLVALQIHQEGFRSTGPCAMPSHPRQAL